MTSTVKDVMTLRVVAVRETAGYQEIITAMRRWRVSACPVLDQADHVIGVVSEADLLPKEIGPEPFAGVAGSLRASGRRGERAKAAGVTAAELMSAPPVTIGPDASVADAARLMYERGVKRLPVVNRAGRLVGVVSRVDVLSVFTRPDAQIHREVMQQVIAGKLALNPDAFEVTVASGIVTVTGQVESPAITSALIDAIRRVEGVVDVRDRLTYRAEDPPKAAQGFQVQPE